MVYCFGVMDNIIVKKKNNLPRIFGFRGCDRLVRWYSRIYSYVNLVFAN